MRNFLLIMGLLAVPGAHPTPINPTLRTLDKTNGIHDKDRNMRSFRGRTANNMMDFASVQASVAVPAKAPCTPGSDDDTHGWQTAMPGLDNLKLGDVVSEGSHDAGIHDPADLKIFSRGGTTGYGALWSEQQQAKYRTWYRTQSFSLAKQMCKGVRFFDARVHRDTGAAGNTAAATLAKWSFLHPGWTLMLKSLPDGVAKDVKTEVLAMKAYLDDPSHKNEVIYFRVKFDPNKVTPAHQQEFIKALLDDSMLGTYAVRQNDEKKLYDKTTKELVTSDPNKAKVIIVGYGKAIKDALYAHADVKKGRGPEAKVAFWKWKEAFDKSEFTSMGTPNVLLTGATIRGNKGQFVQLKTHANGQNKNKLYLFYFTLTFGDLHDNYASKFGVKHRNFINDMISAAYATFGTIGNIIMTDFCGDNSVWGTQEFNVAGEVTTGWKTHGHALTKAIIYLNKARIASPTANPALKFSPVESCIPVGTKYTAQNLNDGKCRGCYFPKGTKAKDKIVAPQVPKPPVDNDSSMELNSAEVVFPIDNGKKKLRMIPSQTDLSGGEGEQ